MGSAKKWKYIAAGFVLLAITLIALQLVVRGSDPEAIPDAVYEVTGEIITLVDGTESPWHDQAWDRWIELVPASRRSLVAEFHALPASDVGGLVEASSNNLQRWTLAIGPPLSDIDLDNTLVHEYAHLITLSPTQVIPATSDSVEESCTTYFTGEGCARAGSIFDRFVDAFWPESDLNLAEDDPDALYNSDPDSFVTSYAATNPGEDLAETFRFFVYRGRSNGSNEAADKIDFMWDIPELVRIRTELRETL
jgi:hypothetical protein